MATSKRWIAAERAGDRLKGRQAGRPHWRRGAVEVESGGGLRVLRKLCVVSGRRSVSSFARSFGPISIEVALSADRQIFSSTRAIAAW